MSQLVGIILISLILGAIGWFWLGAGDKPADRRSLQSLQAESEVRVSLGSRITIALTVALVCGLGSIMVAFLVVLVVGATGKEWWSTCIWTIYAVAASSWVAYSFLNPVRPKKSAV
jgi:hypothetical protein